MSIPTNELVYAGIWNATAEYNKFQFVESPTDNKCYVYIGEVIFSGGGDPATVQPSTIWIPINPPVAGFPPAYGSFSSTQIQNINPAFPTLAPLPLVYDTNDVVPFGVNVVLPSADIIVAATGLYKVLSSVQLDRTAGGNSTVDMYITVNGNAVPNSATKLTINQNQEDIMTVEWFLNLAATDSVNIVLYSTDSSNQALAVVAAPPVPAIPSVITTILRIA